MVDKPLVWLASYPKSGNTWFRAVLMNLLHPDQAPVSINALGKFTLHAALRRPFEEIIGLESSDLDITTCERLRPKVYETWAREAESTIYIKTHDALTHNADDRLLMPPRYSRGALYFLRNPLDVAVSFAHHSVESVDRIIDRMCDESNVIADSHPRLLPQIPQRLLRWDSHVESWLNNREIPVLPVRYEDMHAQPLETFSAALKHVGVPFSQNALQTALEHSRFENLAAQERIQGFVEKKPAATCFFREGQADTWRQHLNGEQIRRILHAFGPTMRAQGYSTDYTSATSEATHR